MDDHAKGQSWMMQILTSVVPYHADAKDLACTIRSRACLPTINSEYSCSASSISTNVAAAAATTTTTATTTATTTTTTITTTTTTTYILGASVLRAHGRQNICNTDAGCSGRGRT